MDKNVKWWLAGLAVVLLGMFAVVRLTTTEPTTPAEPWRPDYVTTVNPLWPARGDAASDRAFTDAAARALRDYGGTPRGPWGLLWANRADGDERALFAVLADAGYDLYLATRHDDGSWYVRKTGYGVDLATVPAVSTAERSVVGGVFSLDPDSLLVANNVRTARAYCDNGVAQPGTATGTITWDLELCSTSQLVAFDRADGTSSYLGTWGQTAITGLAGGATERDLLSLAAGTWTLPVETGADQITLLGAAPLPDGTPGRLLSAGTKHLTVAVAWVPSDLGPATTNAPTVETAPITFVLAPAGHPPVLVVVSAGPPTITPPLPELASGAGFVVVPVPTTTTAVVATDTAGVPTDTDLVGQR